MTVTPNVKNGTRVRRTIIPLWEGVVVEVQDEPGLKPLIIKRDNGNLFYSHYDQVEVVATQEGA